MLRNALLTLMVLSGTVFGVVYETPAKDVVIDKLMPSAVEDVQTMSESSVDASVMMPEESNDVEKIVMPEQPVESMESESLEFVTKGGSYLKDSTLMIGDSRTDTIAIYGGWDQTKFAVQTGLTIWHAMDEKIMQDPVTGKTITLDEYLQKVSFKHIYMMLGINELGNGTPQSFAQQYQVVLDRIQELQPDAIIYVQSILHVTAKKDAKRTYINNAEVNRRNAELSKVDNGKNVFYLDLNEVFDDPATNCMAPERSTDGVHLRASQIAPWRDYLLSHVIELPEKKEGVEAPESVPESPVVPMVKASES